MAYVIQVIAGLWFLAIAVFDDVVFEARLGRLAVSSAFMGNLFSGQNKWIKRLLLAISVALVVMATLIHIYKYK